ncbi:MAG: U32 family peptidase [Eubacterium sp.]|nr:U32 family peptidase [Eubacterium sp.]
MNFEILAPCGGIESLEAAVRCGANAVYLGTKELNARRNAHNFDFDELKRAVRYCHERNVKVYVTVNTLVFDSEFDAAYETVVSCLECGADAFIVQDLGLAKMIRKCFPDAKLHASTQCSVNTPEGFRELERLGFSRAVVPREMSLDEIKEIRRSTDMELEMFVHGALCMSVSGQCYLSGMLGGRSGNRGLCAQPCRLAFSADEKEAHDLSLKDLSLIEHLAEIESAGVFSLKIEGRMKRPEYVAAAVTACKNAIEGRYSKKNGETLKNVFSRSGFTDGYFTGKRNDMFGIRLKEDVTAAGGVLKELSRLYEKEAPLIELSLDFTCTENEPVTLTGKANGKTVTATGAAPEKALNKPLTEDSVKERLSKLGGTPYYAGEIKITLGEGLIIPASGLNALRREVCEKLGEEKKREFTALGYEPIPPRIKRGAPYYTARFTSASQIPDNHPFKRIFLPLQADGNDFVKHKAGVEIPRGLFGCEEKLKSRLAELKALGVREALCSNLGAYKTAESLGFTAYGDFGLNITNSETARLFRSPVLSFELTLSQAEKINADDTGIIGYGRLPLMLTRNCPVKTRVGCERCKKNGALSDRKGYSFPVVCSPYPCVEILNSVPLILSDRIGEINTDFIHFYFTDEDKSEVNDIVNMYKTRKKFNGNYTRGLYYRGVK